MEKLIPQIRSLGSLGKGCGVHTPSHVGEPKHPSGHPPYLRGSNFSSTPQGGLLSKTADYNRIYEIVIRKTVVSLFLSCFFRIAIDAIIFMVFNTFGGKIDKYRGFLIPVPGGTCSGYGSCTFEAGSSSPGAALLELVHTEQTS